MSANYIKNVAIVGAGGNSGQYMTESLLKTGKHNITALTRPGSTTSFPTGIRTVHIDYDQPETLVAALKGRDVLIITLSVTAPPDTEATLVRAAAEAKVPWILPNAWGLDTQDPILRKEALIGERLAESCKLISELGVSNYICVSTGFWYEWSLSIPLSYGFDFAKREVVFFDDGEMRITSSTWPQVGRAVAALLSLPVHRSVGNGDDACLDSLKNGYVYVSSFTVSQKDMLESVLRVTGTDIKDWNVKKEPSSERYAKAIQDMQQGDRTGFVRGMYTRVFFPDGRGNNEKTRGLLNDVLGLPKEDLDESTKKAIQRAKVFKLGQ